jgi:hypothetical protein
MNKDSKESNSNVWIDHMLRGEYEEAWRFSDEVLKSNAGKSCWHLPRHLQYVWDGSSLKEKTVLIRCYHGLGDTIQFIRFAPRLKEIASKVIVWAQAPLIPLLETADGIDRLLPLHDGTPDVNYDVDVEVMELSHIFRINAKILSPTIPYLHVKPIHLQPPNGRLAVGLVWKAGDWGEGRSISFSVLAPLASVSGITLFILQANAELFGWKEGFGIHPGELNLFDYARVIKGLDLLISVDSMPVHLAGALGIPVWTLLQAHADWRWMEQRTDSPWYPTMRVFRQKHQGEWQQLVEEVAAELHQLSRLKIRRHK